MTAFPTPTPFYTRLSEVAAIATAHAAGSKKVLSGGRADRTRITQIAWGTLDADEAIPSHTHPDMDECYFFTGGSGTMKIDGKEFELADGVFITVPATAEHSMQCTGQSLHFFYFGLQVYDLPVTG